MNISTTQGAPGFGPTIRVRGINSITAGTNPLYVVDGMAMENFDLNIINAQDIQSIEILKDAASAQPERYDILLNLAVAYLADEDGDAAITYLQQARKLTGDESVWVGRRGANQKRRARSHPPLQAPHACPRIPHAANARVT